MSICCLWQKSESVAASCQDIIASSYGDSRTRRCADAFAREPSKGWEEVSDVLKKHGDDMEKNHIPIIPNTKRQQKHQKTYFKNTSRNIKHHQKTSKNVFFYGFLMEMLLFQVARERLRSGMPSGISVVKTCAEFVRSHNAEAPMSGRRRKITGKLKIQKTCLKCRKIIYLIRFL